MLGKAQLLNRNIFRVDLKSWAKKQAMFYRCVQCFVSFNTLFAVRETKNYVFYAENQQRQTKNVL